MMRPAHEAPSDFQEYTLVAVVAVAAHLSQHNMGERYGLPALAKRYKQDVDALEQVGVPQCLCNMSMCVCVCNQVGAGVFGAGMTP